MKFLKGLFILFSLCLLYHCSEKQDLEKLNKFSQQQLVKWNRKLTDVIIADIFTPPVSSRIYAYSNVAAYEALHYADPTYRSLAGQLNDLGPTPKPEEGKEYFFPMSGIIAFTTVAQNLVYNQERIQEMEAAYLDSLRAIGIHSGVYQRSLDFGRQVGRHILDWANEDGYLERTALATYTVRKDPARWQPTPPDYMDAIEPNWNTLRPFVLDSANQFSPGPPTPFDTIPGSPFYQETMQVYETVNNLNEERLSIAKFWDCNPNISVTRGHAMYFQQQISPGGHWVHITAQVLEGEKAPPLRSAEVFAKVCITIADAFISCWDEKYRSNLIRPVTVINTYIDKDWEAILQTPAFPEHTSGHSVASTSAATMLTNLYGSPYPFTDSTEVPFGLPTRHFESFFDASNEAAISRLYGGIHYMPAIKKGIEQGKKVAQNVIENVKTK